MTSTQKLNGLSLTGAKLLCMGFITLFLELTLIRYLAGNIWNLGYFPNLVLISVFIGMGLGFTFHQYLSDSVSKILYQLSFFLLMALVVYVHFKHPTVPGFDDWQGNLGGDLYFTATPKAALDQSYFIFVICLLAIVMVAGMLSQWTAKLFKQFTPLTAYTLDIAGSCLGIIAFIVISWFAIPAWVWFAIITLCLLFPVEATWKTRWLPLVPGIIMVALVAHQDTRLMINTNFTGPFESHWSPYQRIEYVNMERDPHRIFANGINHQHMESPQTLKRSYYQLIHNDRARDPNKPSYKDVLILGAGSGSDVSSSLANGAQHIDAVEIDPIIAGLGKKYNENKPYQNPKVNLVIDDGRAFMTRTQRKYDLVIFALTDSIVKVSSMSQLRLENYLFTTESVQKAYSLLKENGDLVFYNFYRQNWLRTKLEDMILKVSGQKPREIYSQSNFAVLAIKKGDHDAKTVASTLDLPTDDWPFLYLKAKELPPIYAKAMLAMCLFVALFILLLHWLTRHKDVFKERGFFALKMAFVFMGAAFLLLETKSIIQFSLLFGTTWLNNSLVFLAVLLLVLAANWTAVFIKNKRWVWVLFGLLLASTLITYFYPLRHLLAIESGWLRFFAASLLTFLPIYFANLIFSISFRDQKIAEHLFGWNLIGATLGGIAEYFSMAYGYNFLALIVFGAYALVLLFLLVSRFLRLSPAK